MGDNIVSEKNELTSEDLDYLHDLVQDEYARLQNDLEGEDKITEKVRMNSAINYHEDLIQKIMRMAGVTPYDLPA